MSGIHLDASNQNECAHTSLSRKWTCEEIDACKTKKGGFSRKSFDAMGISWPPPKGWRKALLKGKPLSQGNLDPVDRYDRMGRALKRRVRPSYKIVGKTTTKGQRTSLADALDDLPDDIRKGFLKKLRAVSPGLSDRELWRDCIKRPDKYDTGRTWWKETKPRKTRQEIRFQDEWSEREACRKLAQQMGEE